VCEGGALCAKSDGARAAARTERDEGCALERRALGALDAKDEKFARPCRKGTGSSFRRTKSARAHRCRATHCQRSG